MRSHLLAIESPSRRDGWRTVGAVGLRLPEHALHMLRGAVHERLAACREDPDERGWG
jgi:hypothetical protein